MSRYFVTVVLGIWMSASLAAGGHGPALEKANIDLANKTSLQRGARLFVNYCVSCHSASFMRYNRIAEDLGISEEMVQTNLMFTTDKIGDVMSVAMRPGDAEAWFGAAPPDLSVMSQREVAELRRLAAVGNRHPSLQARLQSTRGGGRHPLGGRRAWCGHMPPPLAR